MRGPDDKPLMVLSREGEGRVALLLSDHIWLWARGYENGGPQIDLLRRLSHWLMKQPDLEEEALRLIAGPRQLTVQRQTMADTAGDDDADRAVRRDAHLRARCGRPRRVAQDGRRQRTRPVARDRRQADGARQCRSGQSARIRRSHIDDRRAGAACECDRRRLRAAIGAASGINMPRVVAVRSSDTYKGDDWIGLKLREASVVRGIGVLPVFAGLLGLLLLVGSLAATWAREGR